MLLFSLRNAATPIETLLQLTRRLCSSRHALIKSMDSRRCQERDAGEHDTVTSKSNCCSSPFALCSVECQTPDVAMTTMQCRNLQSHSGRNGASLSVRISPDSKAKPATPVQLSKALSEPSIPATKTARVQPESHGTLAPGGPESAEDH